MPQANFAYAAPVNDVAGLPRAISLFVDRAHLRDQIRQDVEIAGFRIVEASEMAALHRGEPRPLGEIVVVDCPVVGGGELAALARLDLRAANCGAQLIVSTTLPALDDVFGCLDRSGAQILVDPSRAERVIALGRLLAQIPGMRLRELSDEDRLTLLRLTEQVGQIAERLERMGGAERAGALDESDGALRFESPRRGFFAAPEDGGDRLVRATRPALPDPRLVRQMIRQRQLRSRYFGNELFADPAWDMLLDLTAARAEHIRVSVTSLCIASAVPPTTALRWIGQMIEAGLLHRVEDEADRRRAFITLSDKAADAMARYFAELRKAGKLPV